MDFILMSIIAMCEAISVLACNVKVAKHGEELDKIHKELIGIKERLTSISTNASGGEPDAKIDIQKPKD